MKSKILIILIAIIVIVAVFLVLQKEDKVHNLDALNYVLYKFPEFKNISKCEFEEKLMCHEDIIVERIDNGWNITFMNETKGCNNKCVIDHYYSFLVEKDGKIREYTERERNITLKDFAVDVRTCTENLTLIGAKWWATPEQVPADAILSLWYFENTGKPINIEGMPAEEHIILSGLPPKDVIVEGTYIIDEKPYLLLIDAHSNTVYRINKTESVYNTILEKFSTKTVNNESDVLEAFERYSHLFNKRYKILTGKELDEKIESSDLDWIIIAQYDYNFSLEDYKPKVTKKDGHWELTVSVWYLHTWDDIAVVKYNAKITNHGSVIVLNETKKVFKNAFLYKL